MSFPDWVTDPSMQYFWILIAVTFLERVWIWPIRNHPNTLFSLLADRLARRVNPKDERSNGQRRLSGALAALILVLPIVVILEFFIYLAQYPAFFHAIALYFSLQFEPYRQHGKRVARYIKINKQHLAKESLNRLVQRDTDALSVLGMNKALAESLCLRFNYQFVCVSFWFLVTGGIGALTYRLLLNCSFVWNVKQANFAAFGLPVRRIVSILQWLPSRLLVVILFITDGLFSIYRGIKNISFFTNNRNAVLGACGAAVGCQLSGPAYYGGIKWRAKRIGGSRELQPEDVPRILTMLTRAQIALFCAYLLTSVSLYAVG